MKFEIKRDAILKALQHLSGVVERRQALPILGNVLVQAGDGVITLAATDLEVELITKQTCEVTEAGKTTVPARKWLDICRNLNEGTDMTAALKNDRITLKCGKSRFTLSSLPAEDFPLADEVTAQNTFTLPRDDLKAALEATHFSMAQQDVRYYLNGLMMELSTGRLRCVATDGHRLALKDLSVEMKLDEARQVIVPRKGVQELMRLLPDAGDEVTVSVGGNHIRLELGDMTFTSKLIDGRFPDYQRVLPEGGGNVLKAAKEDMRQTLVRVAILSNEKYRGVRLILGGNTLKLAAHNPEQEEAEDQIKVEYTGDAFEIGFNANYLLDVVNAITTEKVKVVLTDSNSSCLIQPEQPDEGDSSNYVVMPMRL